MTEELPEDVRRDLEVQMERLEKYEDGKYELDEDEGFRCGDCGWRGLTAPMSDLDPEEAVERDIIVMCPDCNGYDVETGDVGLERAREKL